MCIYIYYISVSVDVTTPISIYFKYPLSNRSMSVRVCGWGAGGKRRRRRRIFPLHPHWTLVSISEQRRLGQEKQVKEMKKLVVSLLCLVLLTLYTGRKLSGICLKRTICCHHEPCRGILNQKKTLLYFAPCFCKSEWVSTFRSLWSEKGQKRNSGWWR